LPGSGLLKSQPEAVGRLIKFSPIEANLAQCHMSRVIVRVFLNEPLKTSFRLVVPSKIGKHDRSTQLSFSIVRDSCRNLLGLLKLRGQPAEFRFLSRKLWLTDQ